MPSYGSLAKLTRLELKEKVKQYLIAKLGSEDKLSQNVMWARAQGVVFSTFGIPFEWEQDFKEWSVRELRTLFGVENVPIQPWEQPNLVNFV